MLSTATGDSRNDKGSKISIHSGSSMNENSAEIWR